MHLRHRSHPPRALAVAALITTVVLLVAHSPFAREMGHYPGIASAATSCTGDCSGDSVVTVDELVTMVNIALGTSALADCPVGDADGSGQITVDEILAAVNNALNGCPFVQPTPTASPATGKVLYVRTSGSDTRSGADPANAVRSVSRATQLSGRGDTIVVGPGTYEEGISSSIAAVPQGLHFVADVTGAQTGDAPGPVILDATTSGVKAGFKLTNAGGTVIDGFTVIGAVDAGIVIKSGSDSSIVRNCIVHDNPGDGIRVQDSANVLVFNDLVYNNSGLGVGLVGTISGSQNGQILNSTIVGNGSHGIAVGTTQAASGGALLRNNIVQDNGLTVMPSTENIKVFTSPPSDLGFDGDFDLVFPATYLPITPARGAHDVNFDAAFVNVGTSDFHLLPASPALNAGGPLDAALKAQLTARTTTGTGLDNDGTLDIGFHYLP